MENLTLSLPDLKIVQDLQKKSSTAKILLGRSAFGSVCVIKALATSNPVKIKKLERLYWNEVKSLSFIDSSSVVRLISTHDNGTFTVYSDGTATTHPCRYLCIEFCPKGNLFDILSRKGGLPSPVARTLFLQLLSGLSACHQAGVAHRDLKLENILIDEDYRLKIADFGMAEFKQRESWDMGGVVGTSGYMAPEIILGQRYRGDKVDIFAAGIILFALYTGTAPFRTAEESDTHYRLMRKRDRRFWDVHLDYGRVRRFEMDFRDLIESLCAFDAMDRPSVEEVKQHPWIKGKRASMGFVATELKDRINYITKSRVRIV
jgi:serine/threonine protein kinase